MAGRKKRRIRSPHPGVVLLSPRGEHAAWRARYRDPDSGKDVYTRLDPVELPSEETRRDWAIRKSRALAQRHMELESGAPRATGTEFAKAIERYFDDHKHLRPRTLEIYRRATTKLVAWAGVNGIKSADDLTRPRLLAFRQYLIAEPRKVSAQGGRQGQRASSDETRAPMTINHSLRAVRTVVGYVRDLDLFPKLTHDDLRRSMKLMPKVIERMEFLRPNDIAQLLDAALMHDCATFAETRAEHADRRLGGTRRYEPIAPLVAFLLLSGCRLGEALGLTWDQVDLDALDSKGHKVGEIHLRGADTKTHKSRTVGLEVSPALRDLLAALKLRGDGQAIFCHTPGSVASAAKRLRGDYPEAGAKGQRRPRKKLVQPAFGAPQSFTWQALRRTCGTYLTNAPGIFEGASAYRSARQLGHSVSVAETHYLGVLRGIPRDATTLESAMQAEGLIARVIASVSGG